MTATNHGNPIPAVGPATAGAAGPETDSMASRFTPMDEAMHRDLLDRAEAVVWHAGELGVPLGGWSGTTKWAVALVTLEATHRARVATLEARTAEDALLLAQYKQTLIDVQRHATEGQQRDEERIAGLEARLQAAERMLAELVDTADCTYDHHGYCQAHALHPRPCPHERAKAFLVRATPRGAP